MEELEYHPNFMKYVEMIVNHPNYKGLYFDRDRNNEINWVVTGKSQKGQKRQAWWDEKCKELGIPIQKGCYAKAARMIHPTGFHVCQCCGESHSIYYEYPTKTTTKLLNKILGTNINPDDDEQRAECTIKEIVIGWCDTPQKIISLAKAFNLPNPQSKEDLINSIYKNLVDKESTKFSPGVMSNPPDRYDGFHSYSLCCRSKFDTGRWKPNMNTYTQDRRAYEEWSDGDYNLANRLMGEFRKQPPMICPQCGNVAKMSADHIGPISLGFCHSIHFKPMCKSCNSAKNNRFTKSDVDELIRLENKGCQVVSWHSKYIWDLLKGDIQNDIDAKRASSIMAKCHQNILNILAIIYKKTGREFLLEKYLHPEFSMKDYRFEDFDLHNLDRLKIIENDIDSKNKRKNQERYIRVAFESLENFLAKTNRKNSFLIDESTPEIKGVIYAIKEGNYETADVRLNDLIRDVSLKIYQNENGNKLYDDFSNSSGLSEVADKKDDF